MAVKILIQRKVKPGHEADIQAVVRDLRSRAMHADGFISGETLRNVEDPSVHLVISTWKSIDAWNAWISEPNRRALEERISRFLEEPTKMIPFQYE